MGLTFNGKTPSTITMGGKQVSVVIMNGEIVWPGSSSVILSRMKSYDGFFIQNVDSAQTNIAIKVPKPSGTYTVCRTTYNDMLGESHTVNAYSAAVTQNVTLDSGQWIKVTSITGKCSNFEITGGSAIVYGNLSVVRDYQNVKYYYAYNPSDSYRHRYSRGGRYENLFKNSTSLIAANNLYLDRHAGEDAYKSMFYNCQNLRKSPLFRAVTSTHNGTFDDAFYNCINLDYLNICSPDADLTILDNWNLKNSCVLAANNNNAQMPHNISIVKPTNWNWNAVPNPSDVNITATSSAIATVNFSISGVLAVSCVRCIRASNDYYGPDITNTDDTSLTVSMPKSITYNFSHFDLSWPNIFRNANANNLKVEWGPKYSSGSTTNTISFPDDVFDRQTGLEAISYGMG